MQAAWIPRLHYLSAVRDRNRPSNDRTEATPSKARLRSVIGYQGVETGAAWGRACPFCWWNSLLFLRAANTMLLLIGYPSEETRMIVRFALFLSVLIALVSIGAIDPSVLRSARASDAASFGAGVEDEVVVGDSAAGILISMRPEKDQEEQKKKRAEKSQKTEEEAEKAEKPAPAEQKKTEDTKKPEGEKPADQASGANAEAKSGAEADKAPVKTTAAPADGAKAVPPKLATVEVKRQRLKIEATFDGVFESQQMAELVLRPVEWQGLTVMHAVEHGKAVRRGDVIVALELDKIDRALADLRTELRLSELLLKQAEEELRAIEALAPIEMAAAERAHKQTQEDFELYKGVFRPMNVRTAEMMMKLADFRVENAEEETEQLEKMYKADDLTEETEKIVLKRAQMQLEVARFNREVAKIQFEDAMKRDIPRLDLRNEEAARRAEITWRRTRVLSPVALEKQRLEVEKLRVARSRAEERFAKLSADREQMTIRAPIDGVVYFGACDRGRWGTTLGERLQRGATIQPNKVFATVVQPRPLAVRINVPEKQLINARVGMKATIKPAALPEVRLEGIVDRVAAVPHGSGVFDTKITLAAEKSAESLMPGMTGEVKVVAYDKRDAVVVPAAAVATDEDDDQKYFVYLMVEGRPKKQPIEIGRKTDKLIEVLSGVTPGQQVLAEAPKEKAAESAAAKPAGAAKPESAGPAKAAQPAAPSAGAAEQKKK